jgi:hypothetical protein
MVGSTRIIPAKSVQDHFGFGPIKGGRSRDKMLQDHFATFGSEEIKPPENHLQEKSYAQKRV